MIQKIWANTIVNNEENFIWFSIMSVIDYVDKVLVWDTGSRDKTVAIIKELKKRYPGKISFKEVGAVSGLGFTKTRQNMLEESYSDWILVLDGDEVWWEESIKKLVGQINKQPDAAGVVVPMKVPVGDVYHLQEDKAGRYKILGRQGHLSLKAINRKIPGLRVDVSYPKEGYYDKDNKKIQDRGDTVFLEAPFLHATHLKRSGYKGRENKFKHEVGKKVSAEFKFPQVFYKSCPSFVNSPWTKMVGADLIKAKILTPLRKIKRRILF